jgi:hypothetical protein
MVLVHDHQVYVLDFERNGKGQDKQLNDGYHKNNGQHRLVAENLPEFFLQDVED